MPALRVKWTKCLLPGTNTQLDGDQPQDQLYKDSYTWVRTHSKTLANAAILSFWNEYKRKTGISEDRNEGTIG